MTYLKFKIHSLISLLIFLGCINISFFYNNEFLPVYFSVIIMFVCLLTVHFLYKRRYINVLSYLIFIVFALPFIHIAGYIFFDYTSNPKMLWGLATNPYMLDESVIKLTAMMGGTGSLGVVLGLLIGGNQVVHKHKLTLKLSESNRARLTLVRSISLLLIGLFFSVISAPSESVFEAVYTNSDALVAGLGFDSAWMFGYVAITFVYCDAWLDRSRATASLKRICCVGVILFIFIELQLMRGDREAFPWIFSLLMCPYFCSRIFADKSHVSIKWWVVVTGGLLLLSLNFAVGLMRSNLVGSNPTEVINLLVTLVSTNQYGFSNLFSGTWSAVLLTPLSVAGDYIYERQSLKWGLDYWNLLLSVPPGFVAEWFNYVRPWSGDSGPAWDMTYGIGGNHALVLPFRNFSMLGILLVPAVFSFIISRVEVTAQKGLTVYRLSLVLILIMAAPHWLWYGEKYIVNAVIIYSIFSLFYWFISSIKFSPNRPSNLIKVS